MQAHNGNAEGGGQTLISSTQTSFTFNGLGQLTSASGSIDITGSGGASDCVKAGQKTRCLRINITSGGGVRMCDPALSATDTQGC